MDLLTRWFGGKSHRAQGWWTPVEKMPKAQLAAHRAVSGAGAAVSLTYAAVPGKRHVITGVHCGYDAAPTGGLLTIEDVSGTIIYRIPITAAGAAPINFPEPITTAAVNTALIITLAAGGGAVLGKRLEGPAAPTTQY